MLPHLEDARAQSGLWSPGEHRLSLVCATSQYGSRASVEMIDLTFSLARLNEGNATPRHARKASDIHVNGITA